MHIAKELQTVAYLFASILFILSLSGLSSQATAKRGVLYGIAGMVIAVVATVLGAGVEGHIYILLAIGIASVIGFIAARKVEMTSMPQLVAILHSFVGLAAVLVGVGSYLDHSVFSSNADHIIHLVEVYIGVFIGAVTFTGSIIAWGKLEGRISSKPWSFKGLQYLNLGVFIFITPSRCFILLTSCYRWRYFNRYSVCIVLFSWGFFGHGNWRRRYACGGLYAQLLFRLGRFGRRFYVRQ